MGITTQIETVRNNLIVIASMGFTIFAIGLILYKYSALVSPYMRYLLPLPPISVAAYIYVLDIVKGNENRTLNIVQDLLMQIFIGTLSFTLVALMLLSQYHAISLFMKK
ncbi:hypothetical protein N836_01325 [Leptolyngbya sp. Heron Island J]|uniref:hypothetical protein n=1 Tax=Leptolyngbya sp. Heron Island J TaxID=1385935 RepID=UPI0003B95677|nr:hypothetical protein [Leptolyngbya sp. Heron Island J]ESA33931.1 hypothetical protein N836_01325 [Leptolyngbya sp. Heron Island J]